MISEKVQSAAPRPFYLKYNSRRYSCGLFCLSYWMEVARCCKAPIFIVCDDPECKAQIRSHVLTRRSDARLITSNRSRYADLIGSNFEGRWVNTAHALLTPLLDAKSRGFNEYWNIDADDLLYFAPPEDTALYLEQIAAHAVSAHIDMFSQDIVTSRYPGHRWSFGVTYVQTHDRYADLDVLMDQLSAPPWQEARRDPAQPTYNLDRFFSHLSLAQGLYSFRNFNINRLYHAHYCYPETDLDPGNLLYFIRQARDGRLTFPLTRLTSRFVACPINTEQTAVLECGVDEEESFLLFLRYSACIAAHHPFTRVLHP